MLTYSDGSQVCVGDIVIEDGETEAEVVDVVTTAEFMRYWGVKAPGVMLNTVSFGLIYRPVELLGDDALELVARGAVAVV